MAWIDDFNAMLNDPIKGQAWRGAAQGLLQAGAYSPRPINMAEAMGMGLQGFNEGAERGRVNQMQQQQADMLRKKNELAMRQQQRKDALQQGILDRLMGGGQAPAAGNGNEAPTTGSGAPSGGGQFPFSLNEAMAIKAAGGPDYLKELQFATQGSKRDAGSYYINPMTGQREYMPRIGEGMTLTPQGTMTAIPGAAQAFSQIEGARTGASEAAKAQFDFVDIYDPSTRSMVKVPRAQLAAQGGQGMRGMQAAPSLGEQRYQETIASDEAERAKNIQNKAMQAGGQISKLDRINQLLGNFEGGKLSGTMKNIASFANSLGINIDKNLGNKEAAEALTIEIATGMREPGTGTMTDKDLEMFLNASPSLSQSAQGRKMIIETARRKAERDKTEAQIARDWQKEFGRLDTPDSTGMSYYDYLEQFYQQNPVAPNLGQ